jgi:hypothetical protein
VQADQPAGLAAQRGVQFGDGRLGDRGHVELSSEPAADPAGEREAAHAAVGALARGPVRGRSRDAAVSPCGLSAQHALVRAHRPVGAIDQVGRLLSRLPLDHAGGDRERRAVRALGRCDG